MGVISEYAAGTGAEGASDPGVQADVANDLMAKPGSCPTCGQAMPVSKIDVDRRMGMKVPMAYALIGLAMTSRKETGMGRSARLHGAADQALTALGHTIEPLEGRLRDQDCQRLRSAMGAEAFKAEYGAGRTLTSEQIIDLALGTWS